MKTTHYLIFTLLFLMPPRNCYWEYIAQSPAINPSDNTNYVTVLYLNNGNYVIIWAYLNTTSGDLNYAVYDFTNAPIKIATKITNIPNFHQFVSVVADSSGGFLIVYDQGDNSSMDNSTIWALYFDSSFNEGTPIKVDLIAASFKLKSAPAVTYTGSSFVVCYTGILQKLSNSLPIKTDINTTKLQVTGSADMNYCKMAYLKNGNIAVTFQHTDQTTTSKVVIYIVKESDLSVLNTVDISFVNSRYPVVSLLKTTPPTFVVTFGYLDSKTKKLDVYGQIFDLDGNSKVSPFKANMSYDTAAYPVVHSLGVNGFIVAYIYMSDVYYQFFDNLGIRWLSNYKINAAKDYFMLPIDIAGNDLTHFMLVFPSSPIYVGIMFYIDTYYLNDPQNYMGDVITPSTTLVSLTPTSCYHDIILSKQDMPKIKLSINNAYTNIYITQLPLFGTLLTNSNASIVVKTSTPENDIYYFTSSQLSNDYLYYTDDLNKPACRITLTPCYKSCYACKIVGYVNDQQCTICDTAEGYYPLIDNISYCYQTYNPPTGYFLDQTSHIWKRCYIACKTCNSYPENPSVDMHCDSCVDGYYPKEDNLTTCFQGTLQNYFFNGTYYRQCYTQCKSCTGYPTNPSSDMLCEANSCISWYYPKIDNITSCFEGDIEKYYFDGSIYQKCYSSCKSCDTTPGNDDNHQCKTCLYNYYAKADNPSSCFTGSIDNYYLDGDKYQKCYPSCLTCETLGTISNYKCLTCENNYYPKIDNLTTNCYTGEQDGYYFDGNYYQLCNLDHCKTQQSK
jgi:hypothetical protein